MNDIVICGHSNCGALAAICTCQNLDHLPAVAHWLRYSDSAKAIVNAQQFATQKERADALARYANGIHVARALAQGLGTQVRAALEATLALDPNHAYAHVALATFQASVIDKVGPLVGAMTYGAHAAAVHRHLDHAQRLAPDSPAVLHECANALLLLEGEARLAEATRLLEHAAQLTARDAVERLWVELARARLTL